MKRLFVAVPLTQEAKEKIKPLLQELQETGADIKVVSPENIHVTLFFLGDVDEQRIPRIIMALSSLQQKQFTVSLRGVGIFPPAERINVLWIGVENGGLTPLMKKVRQLLGEVRFEKGGEAPHATLARVKSGRNKEKLQELVHKYQHASFGEMSVNKIILYESELTNEGPIYEIIKDFWLQ